MKKAIITGIYGQDGSFLYEWLFKQGYQVFGIIKKNLSDNSRKIQDELAELGKLPITFEIDLSNYNEVYNLLGELQVDEIYHLSASHVSSEGVRNGKTVNEIQLFQENVNATANILAASNCVDKKTRVLTAGSCLMFDDTETIIQDEMTPFRSKTLYGIGKITENKLVAYYRKHGLYACTAILYNHESHRRSADFVTKKIVKNMCKLKKDASHRFSLANIDVKKDWGYAGDYVQAMQIMLQAKTAKDYIVASGEVYSIRDFVDLCAEVLGIEQWENSIDIGSVTVTRDSKVQLRGNPKQIEQELGWKRSKDLREIVKEMIDKEQRGY